MSLSSVTDKSSSSESDNQEENPDPRDEEWLPDDDPSKKTNINLQETFSCTDCDAVFRKKGTLQSHIKRHKTEKTTTCTVCERKFLGERHRCVGRKTFRTFSCPKILQTIEGLANQQKPPSRERKYCCESCGKMFFTTWCLKAHMTTHKPKEHSCTVCGQSFSDRNALRKHRMLTHPREMPCFICDVCGKCFAKRNHLHKHMLRHKEEKPYSCDICGKRFHSSGNCKRHKMTHTGEKLFSCELCGKSYTQSGTLTKHKLNKHTDGGEKPFKCDVCGKVCSSRYTLKNHMVTHTGNKPYNCRERHRCVGRKTFRTFSCPKILQTIEGLANQQKPPSRERKYCCESCGKMFFTTWCLKAHMTTHKPKEHSCTVCGQSFNIPRISFIKRKFLTGIIFSHNVKNTKDK
uniref:C2H2-type domain-containing protein n=1 Tax=Esox lucius TaxID=8010 RepID=A0AAY5KUH4_ESOLU